MTLTSKKLTLKLSPEASKVMPWLIAAKKSGNPKDVEWATREYERAEMYAREREQMERRAQDRRERIEREQRLIEQERERENLARLALKCEQERRLEKLGAHFALEDGWEEFQPTQSGCTNFRRFMSENKQARRPAPCDWSGHSWGRYWRQGKRDKKRNRGQKPRKPWFK